MSIIRPFCSRALAEKSRNDELALPQTNQSTAIVIPKVPSTLDDSLVKYARTHKFSEPRRDAGLGYLEYRDQLVQERETKLRTLGNKKSITHSRHRNKAAINASCTLNHFSQ